MTCIAAIKDKKGRIWMGADRRMTYDWSQFQVMPKETKKIYKNEHGIIRAACGDAYLLDLLVHRLNLPEVFNDVHSYVHDVVYDSIYRLLVRKKYCDMHKFLELPNDMECVMILAISNTLWEITLHPPKSMTIGEVALPYANGSGGLIALGSLLTTEDIGMKAKDRLTIALNIAAKVSPGCGDGIDIEYED